MFNFAIVLALINAVSVSAQDCIYGEALSAGACEGGIETLFETLEDQATGATCEAAVSVTEAACEVATDGETITESEVSTTTDEDEEVSTTDDDEEVSTTDDDEEVSTSTDDDDDEVSTTDVTVVVTSTDCDTDKYTKTETHSHVDCYHCAEGDVAYDIVNSAMGLSSVVALLSLFML